MWLVLCNPGDQAARWVCTGLRERGPTPVELVDAEMLTRSVRSAHSIEEGPARFETTLPDGRVLASDDVDGVLNRLTYAPVGHLVFASVTDSCYAMAEMSALVLSWLQCLAPVSVNRPSPLGLSGPWRSPAEWSLLAAGAGLRVAPLRLSGESPTTARNPVDRTVVVLGEHVFGGEAVPGLVPGCRRLARGAGADLLGVDLELDDRHGARFAGATLLPDLRIAGPPLIARLHTYLTRLPARPW
ncbi:hypothetical protein [Streptomyces sp. SP18CS02]|uniref:hypothetical protein n=1 Tax=Streptomyces sp. SP18CS02 TaxID=3002531 RepID=UPI002E789E39|nr:hypothetical protein [Streptomyces sp. SP18CS02]MEE1752735.1 hypothetical protein [Streptomyces sp. SP18CS02]